MTFLKTTAWQNYIVFERAREIDDNVVVLVM